MGRRKTLDPLGWERELDEAHWYDWMVQGLCCDNSVGPRHPQTRKIVQCSCQRLSSPSARAWTEYQNWECRTIRIRMGHVLLSLDAPAIENDILPT